MKNEKVVIRKMANNTYNTGNRLTLFINGSKAPVYHEKDMQKNIRATFVLIKHRRK